MQKTPSGTPLFHYGWVIVAAGMLCILACLGFGRFALGMLLPSMAVTLNLSYSQMGFISTATFLGYLVSVLFCGHLAMPVGSRRLIFAAQAWRRAFGRRAPAALGRQPIAGDGSERRWSRWKGDGGALFMADHGLRTPPAVAEVDAFVSIGRHLRDKGIPVPAIYFADTFAGLVFLEDLGDTHLQRTVQREHDRERVMAAYRSIIDSVIRMSVEGAQGFDPAWTFQTPVYNRQMILERECLYFCNAFLNGYAGMDAAGDDYRDEFNRIADGALAGGEFGFMHRDLQSRNIMAKGGRFFFIDFQGGRLGPVQYDLASLLMDPYVGLAAAEHEHLLDYQRPERRPSDLARPGRGGGD